MAGCTYPSTGKLIGVHPLTLSGSIYPNRRESTSQRSCGTGSGHFAKLPGILGAFPFGLEKFIFRNFENYDFEPWASSGRAIDPLWKAITRHVDDAWLWLRSPPPPDLLIRVFPAVCGPPRRVVHPLLIQFLSES